MNFYVELLRSYGCQMKYGFLHEIIFLKNYDFKFNRTPNVDGFKQTGITHRVFILFIVRMHRNQTDRQNYWAYDARCNP